MVVREGQGLLQMAFLPAVVSNVITGAATAVTGGMFAPTTLACPADDQERIVAYLDEVSAAAGRRWSWRVPGWRLRGRFGSRPGSRVSG